MRVYTSVSVSLLCPLPWTLCSRNKVLICRSDGAQDQGKKCSNKFGSIQFIEEKQKEMPSIGTLCLQLGETTENGRKPLILGT